MSSDTVAAAIVVAGLVSGAVVTVAARAPREGLRCTLDFLVAATLVRLVGPEDWTTLATSAAILVLRRLLTRGLGRAAGAAPRSTRGSGAGSAPGEGRQDVDGRAGRHRGGVVGEA